MNRTMMKKMAAVVFAAGLAIGAGGTASAQVGGQYCNPNGATTTIVQGSWRYYYTCSSHKWVFVKACPIGGGHCIF
ncbi:hypothetical protein IEQ11_08215 [Lysobacter capsici]|jgi:hypothetical protein|uniref:hypothetical protein n=1 Tax=Lysobacter capsici TaxID=435897 RepID=UPI0012FD9AEA|nr:hypothetical protein [Lysobacter capsici]UOF16615.1 hypothetical protein IEQ11_08215 [Lysobacter capsici]